MRIGTPGTATIINAADSFVAENITIENSSESAVGQAVALLCMGDRATLHKLPYKRQS